MIGQNDLCQLTCKHNSSSSDKSTRIQSPRKFGRNVKRAIDRLYKNLPRTLVSVILPPGKICNELYEMENIVRLEYFYCLIIVYMTFHNLVQFFRPKIRSRTFQSSTCLPFVKQSFVSLYGWPK